jgi:predicted RNA-binding Zn ribbon-like protein
MEMDYRIESVTRRGLALSLVNEPLDSGSDLARWLAASAGLDQREIQEVVLRLPEFRSLRAASRGVLEAAVDGSALPVDAVELLNEVSGRVPRTLVLDPPIARDEPASANATSRTLARIAWSTIELVGGPDRDRLRRCGSCGNVFVATRSDRRWCSVACGNRVRVARHHAQRRAAR